MDARHHVGSWLLILLLPLVAEADRNLQLFDTHTKRRSVHVDRAAARGRAQLSDDVGPGSFGGLLQTDSVTESPTDDAQGPGAQNNASDPSFSPVDTQVMPEDGVTGVEDAQRLDGNEGAPGLANAETSPEELAQHPEGDAGVPGPVNATTSPERLAQHPEGNARVPGLVNATTPPEGLEQHPEDDARVPGPVSGTTPPEGLEQHPQGDEGVPEPVNATTSEGLANATNSPVGLAQHPDGDARVLGSAGAEAEFGANEAAPGDVRPSGTAEFEALPDVDGAKGGYFEQGPESAKLVSAVIDNIKKSANQAEHNAGEGEKAMAAWENKIKALDLKLKILNREEEGWDKNLVQTFKQATSDALKPLTETHMTPQEEAHETA